MSKCYTARARVQASINSQVTRNIQLCRLDAQCYVLYIVVNLLKLKHNKVLTKPNVRTMQNQFDLFATGREELQRPFTHPTVFFIEW